MHGEGRKGNLALFSNLWAEGLAASMATAPRVAIIGVGRTPARGRTGDLSYRELIYDAAVRAYADAGIAHTEVDVFVSCAEDMIEGTSICDEYTPDQLGAVMKPVHTITGDGILGLATGVMQIQSGVAEICAVEARSKASNVLTLPAIHQYALDPVWERHIDAHPLFLAGLEMQYLLSREGPTDRDCAEVVVNNRRHGLRNPWAPYGANLTLDEVLASPPVADPLKALEVAPYSDGAAVIVLASESRTAHTPHAPVWVRGTGWASDSPTVATRDWDTPRAAQLAARMALDESGVALDTLDVIEVDDTYAYKQLQHLDAVGLGSSHGAVNRSGGALSLGNLLEASGAYRVCELVDQLRGRAEGRQVLDARRGLALSWRGLPTTSYACCILEAA